MYRQRPSELDRRPGAGGRERRGAGPKARPWTDWACLCGDYQLPSARQPPVPATVQARVNWPGAVVVLVMLKTFEVPSDVALIV